MSDQAANLKPPRVSVVVPCFNEKPAVLRRSLLSVAAQTFSDFECIVVDESTDETTRKACQALCEELPRFKYVHPTERIGLAASLNLGVDMARGELVARFDSDDVCLPERLASQVDYLGQNPDIGVLGGGLEIISSDEQTLALRNYPERHAEIERRMQFTAAVAHPTVMVRRDLFVRHGGYDPSFRFAEDLDLWLRWMNLGVRFANLPQILVRYRQDATRRNPIHWRFNLRARRKNFAMRHLPMRLLGLGAIAAWIAIPARVQELMFRSLVLRNGE